MMDRRTFLASIAAAACCPSAARAQPFDQSLRAAIAAIPGSVGVVARTMTNTPPLYSFNAKQSFPSASTIKLAIMLTAFRAAQADASVMQRTIAFDRNRLIGGSEFLATVPEGARLTVHDLIVPMIQVSDNTAANLLIDVFGFDEINAAIRAAGMASTYLRRHFLDYSAVVHHMDNRTTAWDMAHLLYELERAVREGVPTVASPDSSRSMIAIMLGQTDRATIPAGVPQNVSVANKTGELSRSRSDVAIVAPYGDSPYVLTVYTDDLDAPERAYAGIRRISHVVFERVAGSDL